MAGKSMLLKNGIVLQHQDGDHVVPLYETDILIEENKIAKIGKDLAGHTETQIVDCAGKIISPGFIDTHQHIWQTQMRGRHAEQTLFEYMYTGNLQSYSFDVDDIYWGQLGGCLGAIDAGTTTVVDHAHLTYSTDYASKAISATVSSGLRCFYCYVPITRLQKWDPLTPDMDFLPQWFFDQLEQLAKSQPFGDGRVYLGLGFDFFFLPKQAVVDLWEKARSWGVKLITSHYCKNRIFGLHSVPALLEEYGLLKSDVIISHATEASKHDGEIMSAAGVYVSVTPESEGQMALGLPLAFRGDVPVALGVDCQFIGSPDLMSQMRLSLQLARQDRNQKYLNNDKFPLSNIGSAEQAFNLGTIAGARAFKMESQIGSIAEGKLADLVVFSATSPTMVCAAQQDPVTAVVRHASIRDIEMVIVDGIVRKQSGKLLPVTGDEHCPIPDKELQWDTVVAKLIKSREKVVAKIDKLDMKAGAAGLMKSFKIDESRLIP